MCYRGESQACDAAANTRDLVIRFLCIFWRPSRPTFPKLCVYFVYLICFEYIQSWQEIKILFYFSAIFVIMIFFYFSAFFVMVTMHRVVRLANKLVEVFRHVKGIKKYEVCFDKFARELCQLFEEEGKMEFFV